MNGEVCGKSWCTVKHDANTLPRRMHCNGVWRSSKRSNPIAVMVVPLPGHVGAHNDRPGVAVDIVALLRTRWTRPPGGPHGVFSYMDGDDVRAFAYQLLDAIAWAEDRT